MPLKNNAKIVTRASLTNPVLEPIDAAVKAQAPTTTSVKLDYDVAGSHEVSGGKLIIVNDLQPNKDAHDVVLGNLEYMMKNLVKNSTPRKFSDMVSFSSFGAMQGKVDNLTAYTSKTTNSGIIEYVVADGIFFIDWHLYDADGVINSSYYTADKDALVIRMINSAKDEYNPLIRRVAKLSKALKDSVLAQTNDTNPFYSMAISEIFDRIMDYIFFVAHSITAIKTAEFWLKLRELVNHGAKVYEPVYRALYDADFCVKLTDAIGRAKASLIGSYYDDILLAEFITNATPSLATRQNGGLRILVPKYGKLGYAVNPESVSDFDTYLHQVDPIGSKILMPFLRNTDTDNVKLQQAAILELFGTIISRAYSTDNSVIQTAFSAFNGLPMLNQIGESPLRTGTLVEQQLNGNFQFGRGGLVKVCSTKGGIEVFTVAIKGRTTFTKTIAANGSDAYVSAKSTIVNFNGVTSVLTSEPYGEAKVASSEPDKMLWGDGGFLHAKMANFKLRYGQSVMSTQKCPSAAAGLANTELYDKRDVIDDFDVVRSDCIGHAYDSDGNQNDYTIISETPWHGTKYKFVFNIFQDGQLAVARAMYHNGDTICKKIHEGWDVADGPIHQELLSTPRVSGYSSLRAGLTDMGYDNSRWTADDTPNLHLNYLSPVDSGCMIMTPTMYDQDTNRTIRVSLSNIGPVGVDYENLEGGEESLIHMDELMSSPTALGIFYAQLDLPSDASWFWHGGWNDEYWAPSFYGVFNFFEGYSHYGVTPQFDTNVSKAQYFNGLTNDDEEA